VLEQRPAADLLSQAQRGQRLVGSCAPLDVGQGRYQVLQQRCFRSDQQLSALGAGCQQKLQLQFVFQCFLGILDILVCTFACIQQTPIFNRPRVLNFQLFVHQKPAISAQFMP